jgi:hypothetical protein
MRVTRLLLTAVCAASVAGPTIAGEITGPPPGGNLPDQPPISSGNSFCSFSGLNDTPDGLPEAGDPGGIVQSYGFFMNNGSDFEPSDPDDRAGFAFPGFGCNPNRGGGLHG